MIKRHILFVAVLSAALFSGSALAELKIGVYDNRAILDNLPAVQAEFKKLNAEFEPKQKEISDLQAKLLALKEDIEKNAPVLSQSDLQAKQLEFQSKRRELQLGAEDLERLFNARRNDVAREIQGMVEQEVLKVAREEQYDMILPRSGGMFFGPKVDITQKILKRLSEQ